MSMMPINGWFFWGRLGVVSGWVSVSVVVYLKFEIPKPKIN